MTYSDIMNLRHWSSVATNIQQREKLDIIFLGKGKQYHLWNILAKNKNKQTKN